MRLGWAHRPQAERRRARRAVELLPRFAWYHLLLVVRSPIGTFVSLVIPLMLLVALDLVTPEMTLRSLGGIAVAQFLTPSMAGFAVLNVGFVDVVIGVTLARDEGVLRRFRTSPAPLWAYFAGRFLTAAAVTAVAVAAVCGVGLLFMGVRLPGDEVANLAGWAAAGLVVCFALGVAVALLVRSAASALPTAYGLMLPVAFISEVFFPAPAEPTWLRQLAAALPVQPFVAGMQAAFSASGSRLGGHGLFVLGCWSIGAVLLALAISRWEPDTLRRQRGARSHTHTARRGVDRR